MKNKVIFIVVATLLIGVLGGKYLWQDKPIKEQSGAIKITMGNCLADDCLGVEGLNYPAQEITAEAKTALAKAIDDEYKALSVYESVIKKFGMVRPFSMIKGAEEQHIASLKSLFDKYGITVPENKWTNKVSAPATLQSACQMGVEAEIANAMLYRSELLPAVVKYEDITLVFNNLMNASEQKHLFAFEKCN